MTSDWRFVYVNIFFCRAGHSDYFVAFFALKIQNRMEYKFATPKLIKKYSKKLRAPATSSSKYGGRVNINEEGNIPIFSIE